MKKEFRVGSMVKLKTGSADMTVLKYEKQIIDENNGNLPTAMLETTALVGVTWYEKGRWKCGKFDPNLLTLVK